MDVSAFKHMEGLLVLLANEGRVFDYKHVIDDDFKKISLRFDEDGIPTIKRNTKHKEENFMYDILHCKYKEVHGIRKQFIESTRVSDLRDETNKNGKIFLVNVLLETQKLFTVKDFEL